MAQSRRPDGKWDLWRVSVGLRPWVAEGGEVQDTTFAVWKPTRLPYWLWRLIFRQGSTVELTVPREAIAERRGQWSWFHGWHPDQRLADALASWRSTRTLEDSYFGRFTFDERIDTYDVQASWRGKPVKLSLGTDLAANNPPVEPARHLFEHAEEWERKAHAAILAELLPLKNEGWLADDEAPLTADQFLERITLETVSVDPGMVQFYYHDGDLFLGHTIIATFDEEQGEVYAEIAG